MLLIWWLHHLHLFISTLSDGLKASSCALKRRKILYGEETNKGWKESTYQHVPNMLKTPVRRGAIAVLLKDYNAKCLIKIWLSSCVSKILASIYVSLSLCTCLKTSFKKMKKTTGLWIEILVISRKKSARWNGKNPRVLALCTRTRTSKYG